MSIFKMESEINCFVALYVLTVRMYKYICFYLYKTNFSAGPQKKSRYFSLQIYKNLEQWA